jgi:hypothetical protein
VNLRLIETEGISDKVRRAHFAYNARSQSDPTPRTWPTNGAISISRPSCATSDLPDPWLTLQTKVRSGVVWEVGFLRHGESVRLDAPKRTPWRPQGRQGSERHRRALDLAIPRRVAPQHDPTLFHQARAIIVPKRVHVGMEVQNRPKRSPGPAHDRVIVNFQSGQETQQTLGPRPLIMESK